MMSRACRYLLLALLLAAFPVATAGTCSRELSQVASGLPGSMPLGSFAAQLLAGAVQLVEPALPEWRWNARVPLDDSEAGYGAVRYLVERDLLPDTWRAAELSPGLWYAMLNDFLAWYNLPPLSVPSAALVAVEPGDDQSVLVGEAGELSRHQVLADLSEVLALIAAAVRPVAIIASDARTDVAFVGVMWNWTAYPRLLVWRGDKLTLQHGPASLLEQISNCAVQIERFALAPVETAWELFTGTGDATMFVLGSEPARRGWPLAVEQADVLDYLLFNAADVRGLSVYAAVFEGQELGFSAILKLVTKVRTNIPATAILGYLSVPPQ